MFTEQLNRLILDTLFRSTTPQRNVAVSMPPRHGKSYLFSTGLPAWLLEYFPGIQVALISYEADFAASWGRRVRALVPQEMLDPSSRAANRFQLLNGSALHTAGAGGPLTGKGFHVIIIDDPIKNAEEALSAAHRQSLYDWFVSTVATRREPPYPSFTTAPIFLIATRWHHDDLIGRMEGFWEWHNWPALDENDEPLCPDRFSRDELVAIRERDPYWFEAMYQGRPSAGREAYFPETLPLARPLAGGGGWELHDGTRIERGMRFATMDLASSLGAKADWTVLATWEHDARSGHLILVDIARQRVDAYDHVSFVRTNLRPGTVWLGVEHVSFGVPLVNELRRSCPVPIRKLQPRGDKLARAMPAITWARAGRVHVSEAIDPERRAEFTGEIARFPYDAHDDQVDVLAYAVIAAMDHVHWEPVPTRNLSLEERVWERVRRRKKRGHHPVLGRWA